MQSRRDLLAASTAAIAAGFAGCSASGQDDDGNTSTPSSQGPDETAATPSVNAAVSAEWNAMRARLWDALSLGVANETGAGASVAQQTFARFENASGEYGAHEMLEATSESNYEAFEEALGELRTAGLQAENIGRAREEAAIASTQLAEAQRTLAGERTAQLLDLQLFGSTVQDAAFLAAAGNFEAARTTAADVLRRFEETPVHDALSEADSEAYVTFESAVAAVESAAKNENAERVQNSATKAFEAALDGSYALADAEAAAGAGHMAALQARGWDAAALA